MVYYDRNPIESYMVSRVEMFAAQNTEYVLRGAAIVLHNGSGRSTRWLYTTTQGGGQTVFADSLPGIVVGGVDNYHRDHEN